MFEQDKSRGRKGEEITKQILLQRNHIVSDVSDIIYFQERDIDLIVDNKTVEIKYDEVMYKTKNIFIEFRSNNNGVGWYYKTQAEYIFYIDAICKDIYIFKTSDLKQFLNIENYELAHANSGSIGALIDINVFWKWLKNQKYYQQKLIYN